MQGLGRIANPDRVALGQLLPPFEAERITTGDLQVTNGGDSSSHYLIQQVALGLMASLCEFIGAAEPGRLLTARTEIVREGHSIVFARGTIDDEGRPVLTFSATIKKLKRRG